MIQSAVNKAVERIDGYRSFTGGDITAYAYMPFLPVPLRLGALSFIDVSTTRNKSMVTSLGRAAGRGYTRGARVVTGVMSFVQLDRSPFAPLYDRHMRNQISNYGLAQYADELPPFNLLLTYVNELGEASFRSLEYIEIVQEQFRDSIDENNPQNTFSFVALHITPLTPLNSVRKKNPENQRFSRSLKGPVIKSVNGKPANQASQKPSVLDSFWEDYKEVLIPGGLYDQGAFTLDDVTNTYGLSSMVPLNKKPTSVSTKTNNESSQVKRPIK